MTNIRHFGLPTAPSLGKRLASAAFAVFYVVIALPVLVAGITDMPQSLPLAIFFVVAGLLFASVAMFWWNMPQREYKTATAAINTANSYLSALTAAQQASSVYEAGDRRVATFEHEGNQVAVMVKDGQVEITYLGELGRELAHDAAFRALPFPRPSWIKFNEAD